MSLLISLFLLGDSIALGTGQALHAPTFAKVGASSCWIADHMPSKVEADVVVISAGVNDPPGRCVPIIREKISARKVIWIRPINAARVTVDHVAAQYHDSVITYRVGPDHLHPASYQEVAKSLYAIHDPLSWNHRLWLQGR